MALSAEKQWKLTAVFKFLSLFLSLIVAAMVLMWFRQNRMIDTNESKAGFAKLLTQEEVRLTVPYKQTVYKHFGSAINPQVELPVKTITGYKNWEFLIDSGAVVSALPKTAATDMGADLTSLPRITIEGFAGQRTFAYQGEMVIKVGSSEVVIPVVFSENPYANNILGRIGFFDNFNITFDVDQKTITISKRG
ncbi:MAG: hypothetical protein UX85_C0001G0208 [Candidatus Beckwithbacteria bacterium GW2011_GWB1_47_15]|uniref:Peptidase A2 domain-containing protein n=1 Tax=Candidatus Beckwithbacteria bacterium GW2011_GWB1_47_15 TaxID=1618371 RepID=A0A0G1RXC0_9BACT|nr:hypothetical protein [uncultured bacterium]KKU36030.1 MAG: hypothetical protein UX50_C0001G0207 [Candidatus Beckwithbacteria bacterium GW2011_GWA1_46_30]KKU61994.1 MAG: hypothetical protein UX85_C0001G0208 [Candidatus Beckwithbacteria bacterium GW2011_GWB1_47_15]KKU72452.1 MAG: hypothetical protein UX97_C0001G0322 [Candidatus Beckwithbacteria bacterium GW2011_GWA2_47_25]KKW04381.1 MAG: hypothetical protein UY37_C0003G0212 [Candidatus Beckwithbacteria bacterium GW2011_GWC2_49_11]